LAALRLEAWAWVIGLTERRIKVAVIASVAVAHDAISDAFRQNYVDFTSSPKLDVTLLAQHGTLPGLPVTNVQGVANLLVHPDFLAADILVFHFGIYYNIFDAILVGNGKAKKIVIFHNITPIEHLDPHYHEVIRRSFQQAHNISVADEIWADSEVNRRALLDLGVDDRRIGVLPLSVDFPEIGPSPVGRRPGPFQVLFVGRAVRSKGILEAISAVKAAVNAGHNVRFIIAGNRKFSDLEYLEECKNRVKEYDLEDVATFIGTVSGSELQLLYHKSHVFLIPSHHEGFCVPVVEALRGGCIPVGFAAGNIPVVAHQLGRLAETGDENALSGALIEVLDDLKAVRNGVHEQLRLDRGITSLAEFESLRREAVALYEPRVLRPAKLARIMDLAAKAG
jgi:glycosyltransferase involved in cell wall biosynthesis